MVDVVVLKPMLVGGIRRSLDMARMAAHAGRSVVVTTSLEGAVGRSGAFWVALCAPSVLACGLDTGHWLVEEAAVREDS